MKIETLEVRTKPGRAASLVFGFDAEPDTEIMVAEVDLGKSGRMVCSLQAIGVWRVDALFTAAGVPVFCNGIGSSLSRPASASSFALVEALHAAQKASGLTIAGAKR